LLLGEARWTEKTRTASDVERVAHELMAKGVPALSGRAGAHVRYAICVAQRPTARPKLAAGVTLVDARDVLDALGATRLTATGR